jgi:hypothetical protein
VDGHAHARADTGILGVSIVHQEGMSHVRGAEPVHRHTSQAPDDMTQLHPGFKAQIFGLADVLARSQEHPTEIPLIRCQHRSPVVRFEDDLVIHSS